MLTVKQQTRFRPDAETVSASDGGLTTTQTSGFDFQHGVSCWWSIHSPRMHRFELETDRWTDQVSMPPPPYGRQHYKYHLWDGPADKCTPYSIRGTQTSASDSYANALRDTPVLIIITTGKQRQRKWSPNQSALGVAVCTKCTWSVAHVGISARKYTNRSESWVDGITMKCV